MNDDTLKKLRSSAHGVRLAAWQQFVDDLVARGRRLTRKEARGLEKILREEENDDVHRFATDALMGYILMALATVNPVDEKTLDEWFSDLFHRRSALFSTKEPVYKTRDSIALASLARRFPQWDYEDTDLQRLPLDDDQLGKLLQSREYETILIVGRPWMFGNYALDIQNATGAGLHFHFPCSKRPANLKRGAISPTYHCIEERFTGGERQIYSTTNQGKTRTDYGLVQVYPKYRDWLTLVMCGGCSSLGTLGAAIWLSKHLRTRAISAPGGIPADTTMEALVKITAEADQYGWDDPLDLELVKLYVDKYVLNFDSGEWEFATRPVLTLALTGESPVSLSFNDEELRFRSGSETFRLIANAVLEATKSSDQTVKVEALAQNERIWTNQEAMETSKVKRRLQTLNSSRLHGVMSFTPDRVKLNADVEIRKA